jgi:hypothetical protein
MCTVYRIITVQSTINIYIQYYGSPLHIKKIFCTEFKECAFKYLLNATLNGAFSFLDLRLYGKLLKILFPAKNVVF